MATPTPPGKRNYWAVAGWTWMLLLSAGNIFDRLEGQNRSTLQVALWSATAVLSLYWIVKELWRRPTKDDLPVTD